MAVKLFETVRRIFPDPKLALEEGIVDVREDLSIPVLLEAYSFGIFPWPHEGLPMLWFCPPQRGILAFKDFHLPRSLKKQARRVKWQFTMNQSFDEVIDACAVQSRPGQPGTWINPRLARAYKEFHRAGYAHSVECWDGDKLIGGLYGVYVGGVFSGESMFYHIDGASKLCLLFLIEFLKTQGLSWMDCQMVTPHMEKLGAKYISRIEYLKRLEVRKKKAKPLDFKTVTYPKTLDTSNL